MRSYLPPHERVWIYADQSGGPDACWPWTANLTRKGYGQIKFGGKQHRAHRVAYEATKGAIPDGFDVDHTCHNTDPSCRGGNTCRHRRCVNPSHLEAVTKIENQRRGMIGQISRRTHCANGHPLTDENTYRAAYQPGSRFCRTCNRLAVAKSKAKRLAVTL